MRNIKLLFLICFSFLSVTAFANNKGKNFDRVFFIIFENTDLKDAMDQPFFKKLANEGVNFTQLLAITHPSQPNYIALTSGDLHGVRSNSSVNLNVRNIADLLEAQGHSWKVYAEDFPGNCYTGSQRGNYYRKHNPFISYLSIQKNPQRCANIVSSQELLKDIKNNMLPEYMFFVPNNKSNGHDTGIRFADQWYQKNFESIFTDPRFITNTLVVTTFDENESSGPNLIYTSFYGPNVKPGTVVSSEYNLYSLLKLVEDNWNLGDLGQNDRNAMPIIDEAIWQ